MGVGVGRRDRVSHPNSSSPISNPQQPSSPRSILISLWFPCKDKVPGQRDEGLEKRRASQRHSPGHQPLPRHRVRSICLFSGELFVTWAVEYDCQCSGRLFFSKLPQNTCHILWCYKPAFIKSLPRTRHCEVNLFMSHCCASLLVSSSQRWRGIFCCLHTALTLSKK